MRQKTRMWRIAAASLLIVGTLSLLFWSFYVRAAVMEWVLDTQADWDGYSAVKTNVVSTTGGSIELAQTTSGWNAVNSNTSNANMVLYAIDMLDGNDGKAVANNGSNSDFLSWNGSSWSRNTTLNNVLLRDVDVVSSAYAWAVGYSGGKGYIYFWNGANWSQITNGKPNGNAYTISMASTGFGWAAGQGGRAAYCTANCDSGANWTAVQPFNSDVWDIQLGNATAGWAVGANTRIWRYSGDTTWTQLNATTSPINPVNGDGAVLYSIDEVSRNDAWAVGGPRQTGDSTVKNKGTVLYFNGTDWVDKTAEANKPNVTFYGVQGVDSDGDGRTDKVWISGSGGWLGEGTCVWNGSALSCTWSWSQPGGFTGSLYDVFMHTDRGGWTVGGSSRIFKYGGFVSSGAAEYTFDAGSTVNWKQHTYDATNGGATSFSFQWATSDDGINWSGWTGDITAAANSRYLRQRVNLSTGDWSQTPQIHQSVVQYETDIAPPAAPAGLTASVGVSRQVVLSWNANTEPDLQGYHVYRSTDGSNYAKITLVTTNGYTDTGLTNGTTYYYRVGAVDTAGNEALSSPVSAVPLDAPPAAPTGLTAVKGDAQVTLRWNDNTEPDLAGYNLYRSTDGTNYIKVNGSLLANNGYTDTGLTNGTTYYYQVSAVDQGGNESARSGAVSVTPSEPDVTPPAAPTGLTATAGDTEVALNWDANPEPDLAGYNLYRSTDGSNYSRINSSLLMANNYVDTGRINGRLYYYKVTAVDTSGNESTKSAAASATPRDAVPPAAPTGLKASVFGAEVRLRWNPNIETDLAGYNVYRSTDGVDYTKVNSSPVTTNSYTGSGLTNGTVYYFAVSAVDRFSNESPRSAAVAVTGGMRSLAGPPDTKAQVTTAGGTAVRVLFTPEDGVTYTVYRHAYGNGRMFSVVGGSVYYNGGVITSLDPNWGIVIPGLDTTGYVYFEDTNVTDYAEYYYFIKADTDPAWPVDTVTGQVYVPLEDYVVARAFPPGQTRHGEYTEFTGACTGCHGLHSAPSNEKLLKGKTITDLCGSCHDGSGSKYDNVRGWVRTGADWSSYTKLPSGAYGTQLKNVAGAPTVNSLHNVWRDGLLADGSVSATAAQFWQAPGSTFLSAPDPDPGTWTKPLSCAGCHEPHNKYKNYRLLRGMFNEASYVFPDNTGASRTQVVVRGVSEINLSYAGGGQMSSRFLSGSSTSPTGAGVTDFCTACHRLFAGPYNEKLPTLAAGYNPFDPIYQNMYDYDPSGTNADDDSLDNLGTHGWKRHMMAVPATNALLYNGARIIDPGSTGSTGNQDRLVDWDGTNLSEYVPLEGQLMDDGDPDNGNEYARNRVVCLTCHEPHGSLNAAGGIGPNGEILNLEIAYRNNKLNNTDNMPANDGYVENPATGYELGRHPVSGYLHNRNNGLIYGSSSVLARFEPFASVCWRCHSTR